MTVGELKALSDKDLVGMLATLKTDDAAVAWLAAVIADETAVQGVQELSRRYRESVEPTPTVERVGRYVGALSVKVDRTRWNRFWFQRRTPLNAVGPMANRCSGLGSVIGHKGSAGFYTLDAIACEIGMRVEDLIFEVGTDDERERLSVTL